jgi:N-acetylglucosamine kinase-like BadF-type ATPase
MANDRLSLGMDVGGTKTAAAIMDERGRVLGQGVGESGNINFVTLAQAEEAFTTAIETSRKMAGIDALKTEINIIGIEPEPDPLRKIIAKLTGCDRIIHKKEGECSLVGGLLEPVGVALIAGTGSVGWGRNKEGRTHMTGSWGTIGDEGSAYDMARQGVNAAFWAEDGRGPQTKLLDNLKEHFGVSMIRDAVTPIYQNPDVRKNFAALSRNVMKTAEEGDAVAQGIIQDCAEQLARLITAAARVLEMDKEPYGVAATGGLVNRGGPFFEMVRAEIKKTHPQAELVVPKYEPVIGAALIGLQEMGVAWDDEVKKNLEESVPKTRPG